MTAFVSETYELPIHWASYFVNGDATGLHNDDQASADDWWDETFSGRDVSCCGVSEDHWFAKYHDADDYCLACDVATFSFLIHS